MYDDILVPLDGSRFAEHALPLALTLARRTDARIHLVSVVATAPSVRFMSSKESEKAAVKGWFEERADRAQEYLASVSRRLKEAASDSELEVHTKILSGPAVEALEERARRTEADLIVMTTHGRSPLRRAWLGSVADGLIRTGPCPVLLQRPEEGEAPALSEAPNLGHILVPVDGSDRSAGVVPRAAALAGAFDGELTLLAVVPSSEESALESDAPEPLPFHHAVPMGDAVGALEEHLAELARQAQDVARISVERKVVTGDDPVEAILKTRKELGAGLVALSTRGQGGVPRMVLGSVADKIIRGGECPVLVHRPTDA